MVSERKFFQRVRSWDRPRDSSRVTRTGLPVDKPATEPIPDGPEGVNQLSFLSEEDKAAITRKFMNTPVYPSRLRNKGLQAKRGGKLLPHPMRSAE